MSKQTVHTDLDVSGFTRTELMFRTTDRQAAYVILMCYYEGLRPIVRDMTFRHVRYSGNCL